jgi:hypothetical protein
VNLLEDNIDAVKKNTEIVIHASKEVGLEINIQNTKHMLLSHHQNARPNHNIKIKNGSFKIWHSSHIWEQLQQIKI